MTRSETALIASELLPPFTVERPEELKLPFVFNSPHSGRVYPKALLEASRLDPMTLRKSEDSFVEELFRPVVAMGAPLMHAHFPRAYLDLNREPYELDPALIVESLPGYANIHSLRVVGGLGTIARVVTETEEIYRERLPLSAVLERIDRLYKPYHADLRRLVETARARFGVAVLIDCHSMPSNPNGDHFGHRADFVLGDRFGSSCSGELTRFAARLLKRMGYAVAINKPYAGGYITEHYGRPSQGLHAIQIEINRALYMDEGAFARSAGFSELRHTLERLIAGWIECLPTLHKTSRAAAE